MSNASFARYDDYKDSGLGWLGEVSQHWTIKRLKDIGIDGLTNGIFKTKDQFGSGVKLVNVTDLYKNSSIINNEKLDRVCATQSEINRYCVRDGDIFFVRSSLKLEGIGVSAIFENGNEATVFECHIIRFRPNQKHIFPKFAIYQLNSNEIRYKFVVVSKTVTMTTISQDKISTIDLIYPAFREQQAIAAYLDTKTAQIDRKIELLSQKAAQYGKLKQSLINETVTRGVDKTVTMKDSGVEWIGEVPAHWEVKRLKELFVESKAKSTTGDETLLSVSEYTGVTQKQDNVGEDEFVSRAESLVGYKICKVGDLVINIMLAWKRGLGVSSFYGIVSPSYAVYSPLKKVNSSFFHYLLRTEDAIVEFKRNSTGIIESRLRLYTDSFYALSVAVPSFAEQQAIANYLDEKTAHIDSIVATINSQIDKLKELRKTLINDVVTGKIKVVTEG